MKEESSHQSALASSCEFGRTIGPVGQVAFGQIDAHNCLDYYLTVSLRLGDFEENFELFKIEFLAINLAKIV